MFIMVKILMAIHLEFVREVGPLRWLWRTFLRQFSKRILGSDNTIVLPTGLRMRLPGTSQFATEVFVTRGNVDWGSEELFVRHLDPQGAFLDIGANIGYYSLYVLPRVASVHAFEPDPRALAALRANLMRHGSAHAHGIAIGNRKGKATFALGSNSEISHLCGPTEDAHRNGRGENRYTVEMTSIDRFVTNKQLQITGIKIDVEGADIEALEGGLGTLGSQFPLVLTESKAEQRLFDLIWPLQYKVFAFAKSPGESRFTFHEITEQANLKTKMLFLVPKRLHAEFESRANSR